MGKRSSASLRARRETAWRNRLARFAASKLTVKAFCRRDAVPVGTFYGWQARLRARDANAAPLSGTALALSPVPFLDLGSVGRPAANANTPDRDHAPHPASAHIDIRLELGGGVVLHIARH